MTKHSTMIVLVNDGTHRTTQWLDSNLAPTNALQLTATFAEARRLIRATKADVAGIVFIHGDLVLQYSPAQIEALIRTNEAADATERVEYVVALRDADSDDGPVNGYLKEETTTGGADIVRTIDRSTRYADGYRASEAARVARVNAFRGERFTVELARSLPPDARLKYGPVAITEDGGTMNAWYADVDETAVYDPYTSTCGRFVTDPTQAYGLTREEATTIIRRNVELGVPLLSQV